jgi:hypothetical protein
MHHVPDIFGNLRWLEEEVAWSIRARGSRPFEVDHCIDEDVSDMDALRTKLPGNRLCKYPLRCFGRSETGKIALSSQRRRPIFVSSWRSRSSFLAIMATS